jgi:type IV pilus assembly protein PilV
MYCLTPTAAPVKNGQGGAFLLEGLLAIVVFSIGLLALVSLQAQAIKQSGDAKYRADAAFLADQIISQIWVDQANLASYAFTGTPAPTCPVTIPNPPTVAAVRGAWLCRVQNTLPGATPANQTITINANRVTVTIQWQAARDAGLHNHVAVAQIQ